MHTLSTLSFRGTPLRALVVLLLLLGPALLAQALLAPQAQAQDKVGTAAGAFLGIGVGARPTAMGGAQVATAQGPSALYWNPSAITQMTTSAVEFSNSSWFVDSRLQHAAAVVEAGALGHFGVGVTALDYGETEVRTEENPEGTGEFWDALDLAVGVSYARALTDRFSFGGTVKIVRQQIWNESATGGAVDLGVTYDTGWQGVRIGATLANFGTGMRLDGRDLRLAVDPDEQIEGNNDRLAGRFETETWDLPLVFRVGVAAVPFRAGASRLAVAVDGNAPADAAQSANLGAEYAWNETLFVRGGWRQAFGPETDDGWTAGFGLRYGLTSRIIASFDYVFQNYEPFGTPQMFTFGVTF